MKFSAFTSVIAALAIAAVLSAQPAAAGMSIQAIVNGDPITTYDINQRAKLLRLTGGMSASRAKKAAMEELINEKLQLQATQQRNVRIPDSQVDEAFASIAERVKLSPKGLTSALRQNGVDPKTLKSRLRAQIGWNRLVTAGTRNSSTVSEQEVVAALRADKERQQGGGQSEVVEYDVAQVTFVIPKSAGKSREAARRKELNNLRNRFTSCSEGLEIARKLPDVVVRTLGRRLETELSGPFVPLVKEASPGSLTKALRTPNGLQAIAVCNKRDVKSSAAEIQAMSRTLEDKQARITSRKFMRDLRRNATIVYK